MSFQIWASAADESPDLPEAATAGDAPPEMARKLKELGLA